MASPTYACMPALRAEIRRFLDLAGIAPAYADALCLSASEVINNLIQHPLRKADTVDIRLEVTGSGLRLDIADDSTPFASFDAICDTAAQRLNAASELREDGYGLGCIMHQHARISYLRAENSPDGFNHFIIEDGKQAMPSPSQTSIRTHETPMRPAAKPVVFLIDDDAGDLKLYHRMLAGTYDVVPLADGESALNLFDTHRPDLIISDLIMPDMDGAGLRRHLSARHAGDTVPFIFLSASGAGRDDQHILRMGIDDYLLKPVEEETLLRTAERVMHRRAQLDRALETRFHSDLEKYLHPSLPSACAGWQITTLNRMAEAGGGDFILHHETAEGLCAVLADVMGHGVEAKFFAYAYAGYLRSLFRITAQQSRHSPADFLQALSDAVQGDPFLDSTLLTCQSFHLGQDGTFCAASAGHPPPYALRSGTVSPLPVRGPLLGMADMAGGGAYQDYCCQMAKGDAVLLATDGFFDMFARPQDNGNAGSDLPAYLQNIWPRASATNAAHQIWQDFSTRCLSSPHAADDATLIIAAYEG